MSVQILFWSLLVINGSDNGKVIKHTLEQYIDKYVYTNKEYKQINWALSDVYKNIWMNHTT